MRARFPAAVAALVTLTGCASAPSPTLARPAGADALAVAAGRTFLEHYVDADGRVVRRDQGGDTVSEGQAYGLLIADALGDKSAFASIWAWTAGHLQRPDGQLAYHWRAGSVVDATPAADADTQAAWALMLAGERFAEPGWTSAAKRLAEAAVSADTSYTSEGKPYLAAGPWALAKPADATSAGTAGTVEVGYWSTRVESALAALTGDARYAAMPATQQRLLTDLTRSGAVLPADWASIPPGGDIVATPAPGGSGPIEDSQDGLRALVWSGASADGRAIAARWWQLVRASAQAAPLARSLSGGITSADAAPLSAVAAAAAAQAAGDSAGSAALLRRADAIATRYPTYYGQAWDALGRFLLTTARLR